MNNNLDMLTSEDLEAWWQRVPGARRFLHTMITEAEQNKAIAADLSEDNDDGFISIFTEEIQRRNYSIVVERYEVNNCDNEEDFITDLAMKFDPNYVPDMMSDSIIMDVARKNILSGYVIFVKLNSNLNGLTNLVSDFNKVESAQKGSLIFLTPEIMPSQITMRVADYILPYDVQFFAINLLENTRLNQTEKLYTATLISKLAETSAIVAKNLSSAELFFRGKDFAKEILGDSFDKHFFNRAVWETQIQFTLPIVESVRENLIERNENSLKKLLLMPLTDEFGKSIESPWDMELRHLHYYGGSSKIFSLNAWEKLEFAYKVRNDLSHLKPLDIEELEKIFILNE